MLDGDGLKLDDSIEDELEQLIWRTEELPGAPNAELGRMVDASGPARRLPRRTGSASPRRSTPGGLRLVLDAANGSGSAVGPAILAATGATVEVIHAEPDGININVRSRGDGAGSRSPRPSSRPAPTSGSRSMATPTGSSPWTPTGRVVDGDQVLGILALDRLERGELPGGGLVVSVLSNGGLQTVVEAAGGQVVRTPVGDKYILEGMQVSGGRPRRREERPRHRPRAHDLG